MTIDLKSVISATLCLCASVLVFIPVTGVDSAMAADKPNIVLIFIDDMGYGDIGPFGNKVNQTPYLDRMAREGNVLRQFYVSNTACTPSRSALMTGTYAHRIGMDGSVVFPGEKRGLNPKEITIAEILKERGYATGCFGKWHLGDQKVFLPLAQGFDEYFGIPYSNDMWPGNKRGNPVTKRGPYEPLPVMRGNAAVAYVSDGTDQSLLCQVVTEEAIKFIKDHRDEPFFCYVPHAYIHNPRFGQPEILKRAEHDSRRANIEEVDDSVGRILETLRELKLAENTLVMFTSDNGGAQVGPLRGVKGGPKYEGHMREPTLTWWPGTISAGVETEAIATTTDLLPTFAKLTGAEVPTDRTIDGKDVLDVLLGKPDARSPHGVLYYENDGIRRGDWKLVRTRKPGRSFVSELYNLNTDLGERDDVAAEHAGIVEELEELLASHANGIAADTRPAAFVEDARPILNKPGNLPRLRELVGMPDVRAGNLLPNPPASAKPKSNSKPRTAAKVTNPDAPDVLFIAIDDMNDWTTLFNEDNPIQTPNLKRLAARGTFFSKAYCAVPACNPSRTAILTGLSPLTSGVYGNGQSWKQLLPDVVTLPQYFGQHGFATKGGGKIFHHGGTGTDRADNPSFDEFFKLRIHSGKPETNHNGYKRGDEGVRGLASASWDWGVHDVDRQTDEYTVEHVSNVMKSESQDKPLFLAAGIFRPHLPFWAPPESFTRYPFDSVRLPPRPEDDLGDVPPLGVKMSRTESFIFDNAIKPPVDRPGSLRKMVQCYQAAADYADQMVGRLIDQLDRTGRTDNTVIVLWSDHGYHLGDKNATVKFTLWEKANHVPFIIIAPGVTRPGTVIDRPVSLLDIYPTLVELAGLPKKDGLDGVSLVPLLKNPETEWDRPAVMTQGQGNHAVRSDRWRYIRYSDGTEELYDHDHDPWEHTNLASDPKQASVIAQHKAVLTERHGASRRFVGDVAPKKPAANALPLTEKPKDRPTPKRAPNRPVRVDITPAEYKPATNDILIADFEGKDYGDWQVVGDAMGNGPSQANTHRNGVTGYLGKGFINTYLDGDKQTGELISPPFEIERKHINLLIGGGNHPGRAGVQLHVDDRTVRNATGFSRKDTNNWEIMDWKSLDVSEFIGKQAVLRIVDRHSGNWGHTIVDHIFQSDKPMPSSTPKELPMENPVTPGQVAPPSSGASSAGFVPPPKPGITLKDEWSTFPLYDQVGYGQSLRPQFHFTSRMGWLNDPNGMVYYDGEWHMLFQHYAMGNTSGAKSWGNAVSTDLMHWKQLPHAINPYPNVKWKDGNIHAIWSGSAVVDELNALGKQQDGVKTLYAIYTATHTGEAGKSAFFQGAAYSTDKGRTWTKINGGKPVIDHQEGYSGGQRDPRVFYYAPEKYYVVLMMVGGPERAVRLWKSTDLLNWEFIGDIPDKAAECIDMYHVAVDGDSNNRKWVIADAGTRYEVGEFDGTTWKGFGDTDKDDKRRHFDYGDAWYAAQAFNQGPDGRTVHVGWLRSKLPGYRPFLETNMPFTQQMSIPIEITLRTTPDGIRMFRNPVKEIKQLYSKSTKLEDVSVKEANAKLATLTPELIDLTLSFKPKGDSVINVRGLPIHYASAKQEFQFTNNARVEGEKAGRLRLPKQRQRPYRDNGLRVIPAPTDNGQVTLRVLVDRASLELFVNDGQSAASFVVVPDAANRRVVIEGDDAMKIDTLEVNELNSIWPQQPNREPPSGLGQTSIPGRSRITAHKM